MENYVKVVLYAYPFLKTVGADYAEHIRNKALLSYDSSQSTERLAEYLAEEILQKEKLERLKHTVERVLGKLSDVERMLLEIRYFGKKKKAKELLRAKELSTEEIAALTSSERSYFRRLERLSKKVGALLAAEGLTKEGYWKEYAQMELIGKIHKFVEKEEQEAN